jgi:hypothetical protein
MMGRCCGDMMGVVVRFPDTRDKKPSGDRTGPRSEQRFQYPGPDPVAEVSCDDDREQVRGKSGPEDLRARSTR